MSCVGIFVDSEEGFTNPLTQGVGGRGRRPGVLYEIALIRFRTKHPGLEVEEDPYVILPEDANVSMKVEVPFDD
ncbi:hypothetical protein BHE74_00025618 [Ensete ventricosum]|nr:hypothetical protein BHE74_00025618 [Ensete ventricosum]